MKEISRLIFPREVAPHHAGSVCSSGAAGDIKPPRKKAHRFDINQVEAFFVPNFRKEVQMTRSAAMLYLSEQLRAVRSQLAQLETLADELVLREQALKQPTKEPAVSSANGNAR